MLKKAYELLTGKATKPRISYELLYKYQTNITECTPEERDFVGKYIERSVSSTKLLDKVNRDIYNEALEKSFKDAV